VNEVGPVGPNNPPYERLFQVVVPSPILMLRVLVSIASSPSAKTVFAFDHSVEVPLRNCNWMFGIYFLSVTFSG
jgi:hypothetical protein